MYGRLFEIPEAEDFTKMSLDQFQHWLLEGTYETDSQINKGRRWLVFEKMLELFAPTFTKLIAALLPTADLEDWFRGGLGPDTESARTIAECAIAYHIDWLAPQLSELLSRDALLKASPLQNQRCRFKAMAALIPSLPPTQKREALERVLDTVKRIENAQNQVAALAELAAHL